MGTGVDAPVYALAVYQGALYATGDFLNAGGAPAAHIARWDGTAWSPLGQGLTGLGWPKGRSLAIWAGNLVVGGNFALADGKSARRVASWDGSSWSPLGDGLQTGWSSLLSTRAICMQAGISTTLRKVADPRASPNGSPARDVPLTGWERFRRKSASFRCGSPPNQRVLRPRSSQYR